MINLAIILAVAIVLYCLLLALAYFNQRLLVFPASRLQGKDCVQLTPVNVVDIVSMTTPQLRVPIKALYAEALDSEGKVDPQAAKRPTLIFFYGNGSYLNSCGSILTGFRRMDVNVAISEYPGYGVSDGIASEEGCYDSAEAIYDYIVGQKGVEPKNIIVAGWSLGTGVAVKLAAEHPVRGLVLCSAYTSIADMAIYRYPVFPAPLIHKIFRYRFLSLQRIGQVRCPIFIAHGDKDTRVPYFMSRKLADAAHTPVTFVTLDGIGHSDVFYAKDAIVYPHIEDWINQLR